MAKFEKGNRKGGRKPGSRNKITLAMRDVIEAAAVAAGDELARMRVADAKKRHLPIPKTTGGALEYLTYQALNEPKAFLAVLGKTIEKKVKVEGEHIATVIFRDYTGLNLAALPPSILRRIKEPTT